MIEAEVTKQLAGALAAAAHRQRGESRRYKQELYGNIVAELQRVPDDGWLYIDPKSHETVSRNLHLCLLVAPRRVTRAIGQFLSMAEVFPDDYLGPDPVVSLAATNMIIAMRDDIGPWWLFMRLRRWFRRRLRPGQALPPVLWAGSKRRPFLTSGRLEYIDEAFPPTRS